MILKNTFVQLCPIFIFHNFDFSIFVSFKFLSNSFDLWKFKTHNMKAKPKG